MELKIAPYSTPPIAFNFEELRAGLSARLESYSGIAYGDDQIAEAKADRAALNKLKKALEDARIAQKKTYMQPFSRFEQQIKQLVSMIDDANSGIDKQIKASEESTKQEKREAIADIFSSIGFPPWLQLSRIADTRWLNKSVPLGLIRGTMTSKAAEIAANVEALEAMDGAAAGLECYQRTLDFSQAVQSAKRAAEIERQRQEREAHVAEVRQQPQETAHPRPQIDATKFVVTFRAELTRDDAAALKQFFKSRNIRFQQVKEGF